jgi:hypothetical protein
MSEILTVVGVQLTFEFHEPTRGACVVPGDAITGNAIWIRGIRRMIDVIIAVIRENRTTGSILYSPSFSFLDPLMDRYVQHRNGA